MIVDADITKILITTTFKYNKNDALSRGELETIVKNAIIKYDTDNLNNFDAIFRHSKLVTAIDNSQSSILSNITNVRLKKKKTVSLGTEKGLEINFGNAFYNAHSGHNADGGGILSSTGIKVQGDSVNDISLMMTKEIFVNIIEAGTRVTKDSEAGTIDYVSGKISIDAVNITSTSNNDVNWIHCNNM